jgi:stage V sporulation protein D (sporulation-specific penicillin-binding protein)
MRVNLIRNVLLFLFVCVALRLFFWQIISADDLIARAESQHFQLETTPAQRGNILFSDDSMLATTRPVYLLYGEPKTLSGDEKIKLAQSLAEILWQANPEKQAEKKDEEIELEKNSLMQQLSQDLFWVPLGKNLSRETKDKIESLDLKGIGFDESGTRFYPEGSSSAHLLGFVGSDAKGDKTGFFGVEGFYNRELKGLPGKSKLEKDAFGLPILFGQFKNLEPKNGKDLTLNVDKVVQYIVEQSLKKGIVKYGAKSASAVVMDPKTGAIIAMAAYPNYDPSHFIDFPKENFKNPIVADSYEPGSTFKVLVMAAAINENLVKPDTKCDICSQPVEIGGFSIKTWNDKYYPDTTMKEVIVHSDNTGMVFVSKKLGLEKFYTYLENFGFGGMTNIDLQDESSPDIRSKDEWREIDLATASFGQGIAVTPVQMVRAVSVIANGGILLEPHVVKTITENNQQFQIKPKSIRQVINPSAAQTVKEMMVAAVEEGEAKYLKPTGFKVAGKTGTAQIPVAGHYDPNKTIASFVGFAPADDPKFVMLIRYDQPTSSIYGAETAAPTFFEIAKQLFPYFKIAPTE